MISDVPFIHRNNPDSTIDSICLNCFMTVGTAKSESELHWRELNHNCERAVELERDRRYEISQQGTF